MQMPLELFENYESSDARSHLAQPARGSLRMAVNLCLPEFDVCPGAGSSLRLTMRRMGDELYQEQDKAGPREHRCLKLMQMLRRPFKSTLTRRGSYPPFRAKFSCAGFATFDSISPEH
jgi:hypothetical protein